MTQKPDDVDFDTAVSDPAAFYTSPEAVMADADLSGAQKRRFLSQWAAHISERQGGLDEGMGAQEPEGSDDDAARLQRIQKALAALPETDDDAPETAMRRLWRRLGGG